MVWCKCGWALAWVSLSAVAWVASPQETAVERPAVSWTGTRHQGRRQDSPVRPASSTRRSWWGETAPSDRTLAERTSWDRVSAREHSGHVAPVPRRREEDNARHHARQSARQTAYRQQETSSDVHQRARDSHGSQAAQARSPHAPAASEESTARSSGSQNRHGISGYQYSASGRPRENQSVHPRTHSSSRWQPYQKASQTPFGNENSWRRIHTAHRPPRLPRRDKRPNIVLILTDDQDVELGSLNYMPQLMNLMKDGGAYFPQAYTTTPMCCPSRSSILTGMYIHNHEVYTNNENCSSTMWQQTHERRSFATYLNDAGYRTGYFGKYLNKYNGSHVPVGWREWAGLLMNSRYYNYTVNRNNHWVKYGDQYPRDYYPHVITNDGLHFLKTSKRLDPSPPVMMVLSYPAPHGPEDSAPEHAHRYFNASDHHTVAYNYAPNPDKQWILQYTSRMHDIQLKFTDLLMTKRLQTLQTVDEAVHRIIRALDSLGELDNTYVFYTSDHGYHLGQFGLVKGKSMPFEFDIKVPFLVRGPGIKAGVQINKIALNVDLAPTFLDIAGIKPPPHMDGRSLLPLLKSDQPDYVTWRDSFLVESSGRHREEDALELRQIRRMQRAKGLAASAGTEGGLYTSKHEKLEIVCESDEYRAPCGPLQKWECVREGYRWRLQKCRNRNKWRKRNCVCEPDLGMGYLVKLDSEERRKQRLFLKKHVTQDLKKYEPKFIKAFSDVDSSEVAEQSLGRRIQRNSRWSALRNRRRRFRRDTDEQTVEEGTDYGDGDPTKDNENYEVDVFVSEEEMRAIDDQIHHLSDELESLESVSSTTSTSVAVGNESLSAIPLSGEKTVKLRHGCRATGTSVDCTDEVYRDPHAWKMSKEAIDDKIRRLRHQLFMMKGIRKHLRESRPDSVLIPEDYEYDEEEGTVGEYDVLDVNSILGLDGELDVPDDILPENEDTEEEDNIIENETHTHSYMEDTVEETTMMVGEEDANTEEEDSDDYQYVTTESSNFEDEEVHLEVVGENKTAPVAGTESTLADEYDEIIIGVDYNDYNPRDYRKKIKNRFNGRKKQKGRRGKFDMFDDATGDMHPERNRPKNKKNSQKADENQTTSAQKGQEMPHGSLAAGSQFHLYPAKGSPVSGSPSTIDNETASRPICWCDRRMATKLAVQQERAKKRAERQQLKLERMKKREKKLKRKTKHNLAECNFAQLNCYTHDNEHWRTPPLWHGGKFCFCMNAANNTYWCVRTINNTHNFLYCEFITGLVTYYDLNIDPYQLRNVAFTLSNTRLAELHHRLEKLRTCSGADSCDDFPNSRAIDNSFEDPQILEQSDDHSLMNNVMGPVRKLSKAKRLLQRKERRRQRKLQKKLRRKYSGNQLYGPRSRHVLDSMGSRKHKVRLPRKSRLGKEQRRQKRRERRRKKKSRKERLLSSG